MLIKNKKVACTLHYTTEEIDENELHNWVH